MGVFPLERIAIVGGGPCGWMVAAVLARVLRGSCAVQLLELPDDSVINGAIASVPGLKRVIDLLALDETALMRATQATCRLGTYFSGWGAAGEKYFQGHGSIGAKLDAVPFHHHWLRLTRSGDCAGIEEFSFAAQAARAGRFALPHADSRSMSSLFSYAWHFDAQLLAGVFRESALASGATQASGEAAAVDLDPHSGLVRGLVLADGERIAGDLFIDCSGAAAVMATLLNIESEDWSAWLPCDRLQTLHCAPGETLPPFSEAVAEATGWSGNIPLQHETVRTLAYCGELLGDDAAAARLLALAGAGARGTPQLGRLARGRPREFWTRNCLLMPGHALDPLEGVGLHLAMTGVLRLLALFPVCKESAPDRAEYNRSTADEYDGIRDLLALHYRANAHQGATLWDRCRNEPAPAGLARRLALLTDSGRISSGEDEHFGADAWLAVLLGQGIRPRDHDPLADLTALATARGALASMATELRAAAAALPAHREHLALRGATAPRLARHVDG